MNSPSIKPSSTSSCSILRLSGRADSRVHIEEGEDHGPQVEDRPRDQELEDGDAAEEFGGATSRGTSKSRQGGSSSTRNAASSHPLPEPEQAGRDEAQTQDDAEPRPKKVLVASTASLMGGAESDQPSLREVKGPARSDIRLRVGRSAGRIWGRGQAPRGAVSHTPPWVTYRTR